MLICPIKQSVGYVPEGCLSGHNAKVIWAENDIVLFKQDNLIWKEQGILCWR